MNLIALFLSIFLSTHFVLIFYARQEELYLNFGQEEAGLTEKIFAKGITLGKVYTHGSPPVDKPDIRRLLVRESFQ